MVIRCRLLAEIGSAATAFVVVVVINASENAPFQTTHGVVYTVSIYIITQVPSYRPAITKQLFYNGYTQMKLKKNTLELEHKQTFAKQKLKQR